MKEKTSKVSRNPRSTVVAGRTASSDPFLAIDTLEVGPVRVEPRRLIAPYRVLRRGLSAPESLDLIYRFEEDVFDDGLSSLNLATMIGAQVALNYGLFCRKIIFHGPLYEIDRRFLEKFAEHTAREIYVNKFLFPNPFLLEPMQDLKPIRSDRYSRARLTFDSRPTSRQTSESEGDPWHPDPRRHAVLSSGGKDSLLSYGLLREIGRETHPVFVNESGRHWHTALNAYRHFKQNVPRTSRVWTNSDRLFSWMLRHLPFVRPDFADLRSDEYPIRLWTVAVFLFGALPVLRKRGIGRLLIGNEFDTTAKTTFRGIPHFGGLYDQSRYFDDEMSRFFQRKKWGVCQFSVLRPLSELLIQKTLAERYPELIRCQVSCHASHMTRRGVRPCGRCEKCRRIVGMLLALGVSPKVCGFSADQVKSCLVKLREEGVHQERVGAEHLAHLLEEKNLLEADPRSNFRPKAHDEVLSLRFDAGRSPHQAIPADLRAPLYRLFLDHAKGGVTSNGRLWVRTDPMSQDHLNLPYAFDSRNRSTASSRRGATASSEPHIPDILLGELSWPQAETRFKEVDVALLPVGAVEQHGPHLPLDTDAFDAAFLCREVALACSAPRPLVLPLIAYGVSYHHDDFSGTISVSPETQSRLVYEIGTAVARHGITKLVIVNGHGGNAPALHLAAQMINRDAHIFTCVDTGESSDTDINQLIDTPNDVHAGEIETSTTLAVRPHLVAMERASRAIPRFSSQFLDFTSKRSVGWYARTKKISKNGVMGDATGATAEKGGKIWDLMTRRLVELVEDLKNLSLDEIYQRRY